MDYSPAYLLASSIKQSEEYLTYHDLKEAVMSDETTAVLVKEYHKLQIALQVAAMGGQTPDETDMQRFQALNALLYSKPEISRYLLCEMRLQQMLSDLYRIINDAAGLQIELPGLS
jgi:cell fate (sporulation/competence/biofilm development) regulator YlbF (YheA/YmcA/DUF963 family)